MIPDPPPRLPDPYPPVGFTGKVALEQAGDVDWTLTAPLVYRALDGTVVEVDRNSSTDGASVPRACSWLVPRSGRYLPAAVVHDKLYRVAVQAEQMSYQRADAILLEAMRLLGVSFLLRWLIFSAVRIAGLFRGRAGRAGWWRDAHHVIPMIALALPIVAVPILFVTVALAFWWLLEQIAYLILLAWGRADRYVNPPSGSISAKM